MGEQEEFAEAVDQGSPAELSDRVAGDVTEQLSDDSPTITATILSGSSPGI